MEYLFFLLGAIAIFIAGSVYDSQFSTEAGIVLLFTAAVATARFIYSSLLSKESDIRRQVERAPWTPIQDFPEASIGKITGKLLYLGDPLRSPLTERRCAYYHVVVEEYVRSEGVAYWQTLLEDKASQNFILQDPKGEALVRMNVAEVAVTKDAHFKTGTFKRVQPNLDRFLAKHGKKGTGGFLKKKLRFREGVLEEGEEVTVYGFGSWQNNLDPVTAATTVGVDDSDSPNRLVMNYGPQVSLYVTDDAKAIRPSLRLLNRLHRLR